MKANNDYQTQALQTLSTQWRVEDVDLNKLLAAVHDAVRALEVLDAYKKGIFYGQFEMLAKVQHLSGPDGRPLPVMDFNQRDLLHAILGCATESGELLETVFDMVTGEVDTVNLVEEFGDLQWYAAVAANALETDIDAMQRANIAKLRKRFPNSFTAYDAQNRDLFAERQTLEESVSKSK